MKSLLIFLSISICPYLFLQINAQSVQWAHSGVSPGYEDGNSIATDDSGNVYVSGQIEYTTHFDGGQVLSSAGIHDILIGKYAPDGSVKWLRSAGGPDGDVGYGVAVDGMHNCYATGEIEQTAQFSASVFLTAVGGNDIFVSKHGMNGQLIWAKNFGSTDNDKGYSMITNSNGDIYVTGYYSGDIDFDNIHLSSSGASDVFILKLNSNGIVQWVKKGAGSDVDRGKGITLDSYGNIYVAGYFTDQATFGGTTVTNNSSYGGYLAKYDTNGQLVWIQSNCCGDSKYYGVSKDENNNMYVTGTFYGTVTIGTTTLNSSGDADILIVKYDTAGNVVWAKKAGGPYEDMGNGISVDSINHLFYITGQIDDHGYFDSYYAGAAGNRDVFIATYDINGNCEWVKPYGGNQRDIGYGIANDHNGNIFSTGIFTESATFGSYNLIGDTLSEFYIEKVMPPGIPPLTPASNLSITPVNCSDLVLNFTPGSGDGRIIIARMGSPVNQLPVDGISYTANSVFGSGSNLGSGNYVVYKSSGDSVTVAGLTGGTTYYFKVFEFNGSGSNTAYLINNPAVASQTSGNYSVNIQPSSNSLCVGDTITLTASGGGTYSWSPASGLSTTTGSVVNAFPSSTTTYSLTANNNGCLVHDTQIITVNSLPVVSFSLSNSVCENGSPIVLAGGTPSGGVYSGSGVASGVFDPTVTGAGSIPITYSYTNINGCSNYASSSVTVYQLPLVSLSFNNSVCDNNSPFPLTGGTPSGGIYSGTGVTSGSFNPAISGVGSIPITYSYTDSHGCANSATSPITVNAAPNVKLGNDTTICAYSSITLNAGSGFANYTWSTGSVQSSITVDSSGTGLGTASIFVVVDDNAGCSNTDYIQITFSVCTGIENANENHDLHIYPIPFTHTLHLLLDQQADIYVYDMTGKLVEKMTNMKGNLDFGENFSTGVYSVIVLRNDKKTIFRVVKNNIY